MPMTMAKRERMAPKEAGGWLLVGLAALAGVALYGKAFGTPGRNAWDRASVLFSPGWWSALMRSNVEIPQADIDWVYENGTRIRLSVRRFHDARGLLIDQDAQAAGAIEALPNPLAVCYFVYLFADEYGATPGTWGREFLSDAAMGAAAAHLRRIHALAPYAQNFAR
jgi:hypothetical protein